MSGHSGTGAARPRILAVAGSLRRGSYNARLLALAVRGATAAGAEVTVCDLARYPLPLYDADQEAAGGLPSAALELQALLSTHRGLLVASPEYNGSVPPLLVNVIAWTSRPSPGRPRAACFKDKAAGLLSASVAPSAGLRGLAHLGALLGNLGVIVLPYPVGIEAGVSGQAFNADGTLASAALQRKVEDAGAAVAAFLGRFS
jgi:NAD(P)H-dependent FMN reductase